MLLMKRNHTAIIFVVVTDIEQKGE